LAIVIVLYVYLLR